MGNICMRIKNAQSNHKEGVVLPEELITQVLMWLTVKSLLRFKCVSKSFCAIINSQHFIKSHLQRSSEDRSLSRLIFLKRNQISTNYNLAKVHVSDRLDVLGYCNGILLLIVGKYEPALWNPSTNQYRILPTLPGHPNSDDTGVLIKMGLGYDSSQDEYKVVVIKQFKVEFGIWIFGLKSNSWKRVRTDFFARESVNFISSSGYLADGGLHWLCCRDTSHDMHILAFEMSKETFSTVTPPAYFLTNVTVASLHVLDGCLCIGWCPFEDEALLYIWKKDGSEFKWSLLYWVTQDQFPPFLRLRDFYHVRVLGYSMEGDSIILNFGLPYLVLYDQREKSFQPMETTIPYNSKLFPHIRSFAESLVSIRARDPYSVSEITRPIDHEIYHKTRSVVESLVSGHSINP